MPAQEMPRTEAPGPEDFADDASIREPFTSALNALDMKTLSEAADPELPALLTPLADAYERWIDGQARRLDDPAEELEPHADAARRHLDLAGVAVDRMRAGIAALRQPDVAEAFRFANHAMWQQRVHTIAADTRRRDPALKLHAALDGEDRPQNRSWRPFQLAVVLLNLPALADPRHADRTSKALVDLLGRRPSCRTSGCAPSARRTTSATCSRTSCSPNGRARSARCAASRA